MSITEIAKNTDFYKQMLNCMTRRELSIRDFAKECNLCYSTLIEFFNDDKPFRPLRKETMGKIHNRIGISFETMEEYNKAIKKGRE